MTALRLSFAFDDSPASSFDFEIREIEVEDQARRRCDIAEIVRSRCCGLLEIYQQDRQVFKGWGKNGEGYVNEAIRSRLNWISVVLASYFELIHRTQQELVLMLLLNDLRCISNHDLQRTPVEELASILLAHNHEIFTQCGSNLFWELLSDLHPKYFIKPEVHFLSKSIINFLEKPDVWTELQRITSPTGFDPNVSLLKSSLREMKAVSKEFETRIDESFLWGFCCEPSMSALYPKVRLLRPRIF